MIGKKRKVTLRLEHAAKSQVWIYMVSTFEGKRLFGRFHTTKERYEDLKGHAQFESPLSSVIGMVSLNEFVFFFYSTHEVHAYHKVDRYWEEDITPLPRTEELLVASVGGKWLVALTRNTLNLVLSKLNVQEFLYGDWEHQTIPTPLGLSPNPYAERNIYLVPFCPKPDSNALMILSTSLIDHATVWDLDCDVPNELPWSLNSLSKELLQIEPTEI